MATRRDPPPSGDSLSVARLVAPARRREWEDELVRFQVDELNALHDGLAVAVAPQEREGRLARARARVAPIVRAAGWIPEPAVRALRAMVQAGFEEPEDAFGAALLLSALAPGERARHGWIDEWLGSLPADTVRLLADLRYDSRLPR